MSQNMCLAQPCSPQLPGLRFLIYDVGTIIPPGLLQSFGVKYLKTLGLINC